MIKEGFEERMKALLGSSYGEYAALLKKPAYRGFRINLLKTNEEEFFSLVPYEKRKSPFCDNGYYLENQSGVGARMPWACGLLYLQEPSAASAVSIMKPQPGMTVLDLCAAPGSKTTQIAERMNNEGLIVANEINGSRAQILKENVERSGAANVLVLNADPQKVADAFPEFFDLVLCDAPCSGEGMFRKDPMAAEQWSQENVIYCSQRQRNILESAYHALKPQGSLVYSTCTFSKEENEDTVAAFLSRHADMTIEDVNAGFGRSGIPTAYHTEKAVRIFPMDKGEGHFVCRMKKSGEGRAYLPSALRSEPIAEEAQQFLKQNLSRQYPYLYQHNGKVYGGTFPFISCGSCRIVRDQVLLGEIRHNRFEPSHALWLSSYTEPLHKVELNDEDGQAYLRGETIRSSLSKGYYAACFHGHPAGGVKSDGTMLKNRYPKEYRLHGI